MRQAKLGCYPCLRRLCLLASELHTCSHLVLRYARLENCTDTAVDMSGQGSRPAACCGKGSRQSSAHCTAARCSSAEGRKGRQPGSKNREEEGQSKRQHSLRQACQKASAPSKVSDHVQPFARQLCLHMPTSSQSHAWATLANTLLSSLLPTAQPTSD